MGISTAQSIFCYHHQNSFNSTKNKTPERLKKSLGVKDDPHLPDYAASREDLLDRIGWALDSDGVAHGHNFNSMADFVKCLIESSPFNGAFYCLRFG